MLQLYYSPCSFSQYVCSPSFTDEKLPEILDEIQFEYERRTQIEEERRSQVIIAVSEGNKSCSRFECGGFDYAHVATVNLEWKVLL